MKVLHSWLQEFIDLPEGVYEVAHKLTFSGLEVEEVEAIGPKGDWNGLVVAEVLEVWKHPNADRLRITRVNAGAKGQFQVVCGADNVAAGQKVVLATVGSILNPAKGDPFTIKSSKIRGEQSDGMLCAEDEIGFGTSHDGIMVLPPDAPVGVPVSEVLKVDRDYILHIGLTANRGDAASHMGVVRDLSALFNRDWKMNWPIINSGAGTSDFKIEIENPADCGRYSGWEMRGVKVYESPEWLRRKLEKLGIRSINNLVDISNYIVHHTGQPIHIFDADKIAGNLIKVRRAKANEPFKALDGMDHKLNEVNLVIADAEKPMAMAGVFGGEWSGVSDRTTRIFIESAWFSGTTVRKSAKSKAYNTDASFRFERGTDPEITLKALHLTAKLIMEIAGGEVVGPPLDLYPGKPEDKIIELPKSLVSRTVGQEIPESESASICARLGMELLENTTESWKFKVPHFKPDVFRPIDIVEEIVRIYGYDRIEIPNILRYEPDIADADPRFKLKERTADLLRDNGMLEIATNTLTKPDFYSDFDESSFVKLLNPLSHDLSILRPTAAYAGLEAIAYNRNRGRNNLRFFEFGKSYATKDDKYEEQDYLCLWFTGKHPVDNWRVKAEDAGFFMVKEKVEKVFALMGLEIDDFDIRSGNFKDNPTAENPIFIGTAGNEILKKFDISAPVWLACLHWNSLSDKAVNQTFKLKPVSRFPEVKRDLSLVIDKNIGYRQLKQIAQKVLGEMLADINIFDVYEGDRIADGKKAYAIRYTLHNLERTLTDTEIEESLNRLVSAYEIETGAYLRK